jgi:hypothetical protein
VIRVRRRRLGERDRGHTSVIPTTSQHSVPALTLGFTIGAAIVLATWIWLPPLVVLPKGQLDAEVPQHSPVKQFRASQPQTRSKEVSAGVFRS